MNKIKEAFSFITAEVELKQNTLQAINEHSGKKKPRSLTRTLSLVASAACAVVLLVVGGVLYTTQTAFVSIDVNPSIELSLNRFDRVLQVVPKNEDGERVVSSIELKNMKYADALKQIIEAERVQGYLDNADMVFAVQSEDAGQQEILIQESAVYANNAVGTQRTTCYAVDSEVWEEAHQHGISPGKYKAIEELQQYDPAVSVEEYAHHSMRDIHQELRHHQEGTATEDSTSVNGTEDPPANGNGQMNGQGHGYGSSGGQGPGNQGNPPQQGTASEEPDSVSGTEEPSANGSGQMNGQGQGYGASGGQGSGNQDNPPQEGGGQGNHGNNPHGSQGAGNDHGRGHS